MSRKLSRSRSKREVALPLRMLKYLLLEYFKNTKNFFPIISNKGVAHEITSWKVRYLPAAHVIQRRLVKVSSGFDFCVVSSLYVLIEFRGVGCTEQPTTEKSPPEWYFWVFGFKPLNSTLAPLAWWRNLLTTPNMYLHVHGLYACINKYSQIHPIS